jgi:hypothetical protein
MLNFPTALPERVVTSVHGASAVVPQAMGIMLYGILGMVYVGRLEDSEQKGNAP